MSEERDAVYVWGGARTAGGSEKLRYSLRSLERNAKRLRNVIIAGAELPDWMIPSSVVHIYVPHVRGQSRYAATTRNLMSAACSEETSEFFWLFNDDFYVMKPTYGMPHLHRGTCDDVIVRLKWADRRYMADMRRANDVLKRFGRAEHPLCYEVHAPLQMYRPAAREVLGEATRLNLHSMKRTLYGNTVGIGGQLIRDPKVLNKRGGVDPAAQFLSIGPWIGTEAVEHIKATFDQPSRFEKG